ncbi:MAG: nucleotidyltransferase family protein [Bacteroidales bacterium]
MKAMILAAGIGSRLRPVTSNIPKALVEVGGKTMLERTICHLKQYGFDELIINLHHFPEKIKNYLTKHHYFGVNISLSEESPELLDTGGALKHASWFFDGDQSFLIHNVDVLSNLNISKLYNYHQARDALATLVVQNRPTSRYLLFDEQNTLCGWENTKTGKKVVIKNNKTLKRLAFNGIHVTNPSIFNHMPGRNVFSIMDIYLKAAKEKNILAYIDSESYWFDIGNPESLEKARNFISDNESKNN